jgi:hypothetical protein
LKQYLNHVAKAFSGCLNVFFEWHVPRAWCAEMKGSGGTPPPLRRNQPFQAA